MKTGKCPSCHSDVIIDDVAYEGDLVDCSNCGAELEIIALNPLQIGVIESDLEEEFADEEKVEDEE